MLIWCALLSVRKDLLFLRDTHRVMIVDLLTVGPLTSLLGSLSDTKRVCVWPWWLARQDEGNKAIILITVVNTR